MATPSALEDHHALQKLATEYANAIDAREFDRLDQVFTPDAAIDYTSTGGIAGSYAEIKPWLARSLKFFRSHMHLMGNFQFTVTGDTATGQVSCFNPMVARGPLGGSPVVIFGIWYHDTYVRTAQGWRIASRRLQQVYTFNVPWWMRLGTMLVGPYEKWKKARQSRA